MIETSVEIPTADGRMPCFVTHPEEGGPFPLVVVYMDMFGLRETFRDVARRIGVLGYCCAVPDLYYREGRVLYDLRDAEGRTLSGNRMGHDIRDVVIAQSRKLTDAMAMADTGALIARLADQAPARTDAVGTVGYCMGGRHALLAGAHHPASVRAAASLHGTLLVTDRPDSPHRLLERLAGEFYCGFGSADPYATPEMLAAFEPAAEAAPARYTRTLHEGTPHGYAVPDRDVYDRRAVARDWEMILRMYQRQIPPYGGAIPD